MGDAGNKRQRYADWGKVVKHEDMLKSKLFLLQKKQFEEREKREIALHEQTMRHNRALHEQTMKHNEAVYLKKMAIFEEELKKLINAK